MSIQTDFASFGRNMKRSDFIVVETITSKAYLPIQSCMFVFHEPGPNWSVFCNGMEYKDTDVSPGDRKWVKEFFKTKG
jgi:hypothetical protein